MTDPYGQPPSPYGPPPVLAPSRRPGTVTAAAVVAIVLSSLSALGGIFDLVFVAVARDWFRDQLVSSGSWHDLESEGITPDDVISGMAVAGVVVLVFSLAAIVTAVFVLRRSRPARIVLTVLAAITIAISLLSVGSGLSVLSLVGGIVVIVLLFGRRANQWFAGTGSQQQLS